VCVVLGQYEIGDTMRQSFNKTIIPPLALAATAALLVYFSVDLQITQFFQQFDNTFFYWLMIAVSWPGYRIHQLVIALIAAAILLHYRHRIEAVCLLISLGSGLLLASTIKLIVARPRPTADLAQIYRNHSTWSFPSGHVVSYVAFYGFLFYLVYTRMPHSRSRSTLLVIFGALICLVGLSRVYLGAHWASDALAGYCFGFLWLTLMIQLYLRLKAGRSTESAY
jgi:membrane-associated phospholipid phosphatase